MGLRRNRKPEVVLDELASRQQNTLDVFEVAASSLERIAVEAEEVQQAAEEERRRHEVVSTVASQQAEEARRKAETLRGLFA